MTNTEKLDKLLESSARIETRMDAQDRRINDHEKTLYGNGKPGLKERQTITDQVLSGFKGFGERLTKVETKQSNCVAAKGHVRSTVVFAITIIASAVSVLTLAASVVSKFFWHV